MSFNPENLLITHNNFLIDGFINMITRIKNKKIVKNLNQSLTLKMIHHDIFSETKSEIDQLTKEATSDLQNHQFGHAFNKIRQIVNKGNFILNEHEFWLLAKSSD